MNYEEATRITAVIAMANPAWLNKDLKGTARIYSEVFEKDDYRLVKAAVIKMLNESTAWPTVAHIRKAINELVPDPSTAPAASNAWDEVQRAISTHGLSRFPKNFSHAAIDEAVRIISPERICLDENVSATYAHFAKIYQEQATKANNKSKAPELLERYAPDLMRLTDDLANKMDANKGPLKLIEPDRKSA